MPSAWIQHVKDVAEKEGLSYKEALSVASKTYTKKPVIVKPKGPNPWLAHVSSYREKHPDSSYKQALVEAKKTYKSSASSSPTVSKKKPKMKGSALHGGVNPMAVAQGVETVVNLLSETGILEGSKASIKSLTNRLAEQLERPEFFALRDLTTNVLHQKVRALKDTEFFLEQNKDRFLPWRIRHIKFKINKLKNEIESIVNRIVSLKDYMNTDEKDYEREVEKKNKAIEKDIKSSEKKANKEEEEEGVDEDYTEMADFVEGLASGAGLHAGSLYGGVMHKGPVKKKRKGVAMRM